MSEPKEELLSSPTYVPPPALSSATISEVIDANSEQDNTDEAKSSPPAPGPAVADAPAAANLDDMEEEDEDDHAIPAVPKVLFRRTEISSPAENSFFTIVGRPATKPVITSKWIFKKKRGLSGAVEKYKARIVAQGFLQQEGVDYTETYSPIVHFESIRMMIAATASKGMQLEQMEVTTKLSTPTSRRKSTLKSFASLSTTPELLPLPFPQAASSVEQIPLSPRRNSTGWTSSPIAVQ